MFDSQLPVQVMPNAGRVHGRIQKISPNPKHRGDALLRIHVLDVEDVPGFANFVVSEKGRDIHVTLRRGRCAGLRAGDYVRMTVHYGGDEHGGGYFALAEECERLDT